MSGSPDRRDALDFLNALENGVPPASIALAAAERIDPVLVYAIVSYLRAIHPASDPAASAVLERVVRLTSASPAVLRKHREGERDPVARWFESEYNYRDFRGRGEALIDLLLEKIEL